MSAHTFKPHHLTMGEPATFGQRYTYAIDHPIDAMLENSYFNGARHRLRAGDTIRVMQLQVQNTADPDNRVLAFADLLITQASNDGVEFVVERPAVKVPRAKHRQPKKETQKKETYVSGEAEVKELDDGTYRVMVGDEPVADFKDMQQALDVASGSNPIPSAAA